MKKYNCYACGTETSEGDFVVKQGDLDNGGYGLCRRCVEKGIFVMISLDTKLIEPAPVTDDEYKQNYIEYFDNFNTMINGITPSEVATAWFKLNFNISKIYRWNLERAKSPLYSVEDSND